VDIKKAVITAAGRGLRTFPAANPVQKALLPLVDRDGLTKPVLQIIAEEAIESGIDEVCVVCAPGEEALYRALFDDLRANLAASPAGESWAQAQAARIERLVKHLHFAEQPEPLGYGHAVYCARDFAKDDPVLLLLGDHVYVSGATGRCAAQLLARARTEGCTVSAVQATREHLVGRYGTVRGRREPAPGLYQVEHIIEKPALSQAELELQTPGLRAGYYLCLLGMHVLTPGAFAELEAHLAGAAPEGGYQLTNALDALAQNERVLALEADGRRYDIGQRFGLLQAQVAIALSGGDRDEMLTTLLEGVAEAGRAPAGAETK
jgi:UTP--glucose-1-phosphate uridylyltransferase